MPRTRTAPFSEQSFPTNPYFRMPDGRRMLFSDIAQANDAMMFGDAGTPRASTPWIPTPRSGEPTVQIRNERAPRDIVSWNGRPIVETGTTIYPSQISEDTLVEGTDRPNLPHRAIDFPSGPMYQPTGDQFDELSGSDYEALYPETNQSRFTPLASNYPYGEPEVETPTSAAPFRSAGNLDAEPSLFPSADEWWKQDQIMGNASASASLSQGDGGSIWEGGDTMGEFAETSLGTDLNADLGSLGFGEGYPNVESPFAPTAEGTGIPVEPGVLPQRTGDIEWTTSPEERRFLPSPEQSSNPSGPDIRTFGNNFSLGEFLNASLGSMRYGEGYGVSGGNVTYAGGTEHTPGTGGTAQDAPPTGAVQIDPQTGRPYDLESIPEGVAVSPEVRRGQLVTPQSQLSTFFNANPRFNNPATQRLIAGGGSIRDAQGRAQFDSHAASLMEMGRIAAEGFGSNAWSPDERILAASYDDEGNYIPSQVPHTGQIPFSGDIHDPTGSFARQNWGLFQSNLARLNANRGGVRGVPVTGGRG